MEKRQHITKKEGIRIMYYLIETTVFLQITPQCTSLFPVCHFNSTTSNAGQV